MFLIDTSIDKSKRYLLICLYIQQVFVKRYGGVMSVKVPDGEMHLSATWKDDNLWIENYNPKTNVLSTGRGQTAFDKTVTLKNCLIFS